ncbi:MAG: anti-sigma factor family protein [Pseudonocardia sp.]
MTAPRRRFEVVAPDWGQTHLTSDAVVAFVDEELNPTAHRRATAHVQACADCAGEVGAQRQARTALRSACMPALSPSLMHALRAIPCDTELPGPPAGLAVTADGMLVQPLREPPPGRAGTAGLRAGVAVSGLALGALVLTMSLLPADAGDGVFGGAVLHGGARLQVPAPEPVSRTDAAAGAGTDVTAEGAEVSEVSAAVMHQLDALPAVFPLSR